METKKGFLMFTPVINAEALSAFIASVSLQTITSSILSCVYTGARFAGNSMASRSVFFGVNMFKMEKVARTSYKLPFSDTRNRTLSLHEEEPFLCVCIGLLSTTIDS